MRYRIVYADGRCCNFANGRKDLLEWLKLLKDEPIIDIRKLYKSGVSDSVIEKYKNILKAPKGSTSSQWSNHQNNHLHYSRKRRFVQ